MAGPDPVTGRERWLTIGLAIAATALFFLDYLPGFERLHLFSDIEVYHYPLQRYAFDALKAGRIPQWDPSMYCGIPFAGNIQAALFYPPAWLMYAASWRSAVLPFQALQIFTFAHVCLAFLMAYWWLRRRDLQRLACALGAGIYAFGGYMMWQLVHTGVVTAMAWMPLALGGIDDAAARRDWRPLWKTALASAMWLLAGYPPSWLAFSITVVIYAAAGEGRGRAALGAAGAIAASLVLAAVQVLPALEAQSGMFRQTRYTSETKPILIPLFVANWRDFSRSTPLHYLDCMYVYWGVAAIFAIGWALWRRESRPYRQPAIVLAACLFLLFDPGHVVYYTIVWTGLDRALQSYNFLEGATAMAALGTAIAVGRFLKAGVSRAGTAAVFAAMAAIGAWIAWRGWATATGYAALAATAGAAAIFASAMWVVRGASGRRRTLLAGAILAFVFVDYRAFGTNRQFNTRDGAMPESAAPRGIGAAQFGQMRANRHYRVTSDGSPSSMDFRMWGLATPQGLDPLLPDQYRKLIEGWGGQFQTTRVFRVDYGNEEMLQTLGVRYAISYGAASDEPLLSGSPRFRLVGPDDSFYRVYEYTGARAPFGWDGAAGDAGPVEWLPERRVFRVSSATGGRFGLVEQFYPGWRATIDGQPAPIGRWRGAFQSIDVPAGEHTVVFQYRSTWLPLGASISLASVALLGWVALATTFHAPRAV